MTLALHGGDPVWTEGWPAWPSLSPRLENALSATARSDRWAVSGSWTDRTPNDRELSAAFARYTGSDYCLPVDHGSSALLLALLGLGVGPGDEVIVSGLTWVSSASVVARLGATPILADIDVDTQCISSHAIEAAITPATRAIIAVHLYSAMADIDALHLISARTGIPFIEDCAQAYGSEWNGRHAGTFGAAGAFSLQQGKALTSGEGGLFITSRPDLARSGEMFRGDGRRYFEKPIIGLPSLEEFSEVQGWNMHLSEFQSAVALDQLTVLDEQNRRRRRAASFLDAALAGDDMEVIHPHPSNTVRGYYHYSIRLREEEWDGIRVEDVCEALSAELGFHVHPTYPPLNAHPLYNPTRMRSLSTSPIADFDPTRFELPTAVRESRRTVLIHHSALLADEKALVAIIEAFEKVQLNRALLRKGGLR